MNVEFNVKKKAKVDQNGEMLTLKVDSNSDNERKEAIMMQKPKSSSTERLNSSLTEIRGDLGISDTEDKASDDTSRVQELNLNFRNTVYEPNYDFMKDLTETKLIARVKGNTDRDDNEQVLTHKMGQAANERLLSKDSWVDSNCDISVA